MTGRCSSFRGGVPGYDAEYVTEVRADASGKLVPLAGHAFLHLVFRPSSAGGNENRPAPRTDGVA
jgi:hypothetical protein